MPVLVAALLALLLVPARPASAEAWTRVRPEQGGFSVELPATPRYERSSNRTIAGRVDEHEFVVETSEAGFWVTWTRLPRLARWFVSRAGIYDNVRQELLAGGDREQLGFGEVRVDGQGGGEVRYRDREPQEGLGEGRLWAFRVGRFLYVFHGRARTPAGRALLERFFASVRLGSGFGETPREPAE